MTSTRQEQFSGTKEVESHLKLDEQALVSYLSDVIPNFQGPLEVKRFKGGQSNPTYQLLTAEWKLCPAAQTTRRTIAFCACCGPRIPHH